MKKLNEIFITTIQRQMRKEGFSLPQNPQAMIDEALKGDIEVLKIIISWILNCPRNIQDYTSFIQTGGKDIADIA